MPIAARSALQVFEISRMAIHNGPGTRTMVHLKGCPLRCAWCSTPESQKPQAQISFRAEKCIGCGRCVPACPQRALSPGVNGRTILNWSNCNDCLQCAGECYTGALSVIGKNDSVDELFREIVKDKAFYSRSGGGVTFSGGEPLMNTGEPLIRLLKLLHAEQISIGFDTTGFVRWESIEAVLPYTDFFLWDIKAMDPAVHKKFTGVDNALILENLKRVSEYETSVYIRCPIIPGVNDNDGFFSELMALLTPLKHIDGVHLLPLHHLGTSRYQKIGREDPFEAVTTVDREYLERQCKLIQQAGIPAKIIG